MKCPVQLAGDLSAEGGKEDRAFWEGEAECDDNSETAWERAIKIQEATLRAMASTASKGNQQVLAGG